MLTDIGEVSVRHFTDSRHLDGIAGHEKGFLDAIGAGNLNEHIVSFDMGIVDEILCRIAGAEGILASARSVATSSLVRAPAHSLMAGLRISSMWSTQPQGSESRGSSSHSGCPISSANRTN